MPMVLVSAQDVHSPWQMRGLERSSLSPRYPARSRCGISPSPSEQGSPIVTYMYDAEDWSRT